MTIFASVIGRYKKELTDIARGIFFPTIKSHYLLKFVKFSNLIKPHKTQHLKPIKTLCSPNINLIIRTHLLSVKDFSEVT